MTRKTAKSGITLAELEKFIDGNIRPYLHSHGGDMQLVELDGKTLRVKMHGTCGTCPMSIITLQFGVQEKLNEEYPKEGFVVEQMWS